MRITNKLRFDTNRPQFYDDRWRGYVRRCDYKGHCPVCNRRIYWFEDGENDPRGPLGGHAATCMTPKDAGISDNETPFWYCFMCLNEEQTYLKAIDLLKARKENEQC